MEAKKVTLVIGVEERSSTWKILPILHSAMGMPWKAAMDSIAAPLQVAGRACSHDPAPTVTELLVTSLI